MTTDTPLTRYSAVEGALASVFVTAELHLYGSILVRFLISLFGQLATISSSRPGFELAAARSDGQGWLQAIAKRLVLDGHEHWRQALPGRVSRFRRGQMPTTNTQGELAEPGAEVARQTCMR
ncbi:hypothetical protein ACFX5Q_31195 [Mesorhizobium sp. IMUNJ 23033]|uniref:hypothetical protein n=1 Tax=Mesorhizobium sp. IMUNJ 23033 TaxID=3378039 RepID=UPI00384EEF9B